MKKTLFPLLIALALIALPHSAKADFDIERLIDPFCLFTSCDEPDIIYNTTNSNNVNSNINSPNSTVISGSETHSPTYAYDYDYDDDRYSRPLEISCYSTPTSADVGGLITWHVSVYGGTGSYDIDWSGTNGLDGSGYRVSKRYNSDGIKSASVRVRSGDRSKTVDCGSVQIYDYDDRDYYDDYDRDYYRNYDRYESRISASCSAHVTFATLGSPVIWQAYASGASGNYRYEWAGSDYLSGSQRNLSTSYSTPGTKYASVVVRSGSQRITVMCTNYVTVGAPIYTNPYPTYPTYTPPAKPIVKAPVVAKPAPVVEKPEVKADEDVMTVASLFSLKNVPWGLVAIMVILVLLGTVIYLLLNRNKI